MPLAGILNTHSGNDSPKSAIALRHILISSLNCFIYKIPASFSLIVLVLDLILPSGIAGSSLSP